MAQKLDVRKIAAEPPAEKERIDFSAIAALGEDPAIPARNVQAQPFLREAPIASMPARVLMSLTRKKDKEAEIQQKREILKSIPGFENAELYLYPPDRGNKGVLTYKMNKSNPNEPEKLVDAPMDKFTGFGELAIDILEFFAADAGAIFGEGVAIGSRAEALGDLAQKAGPAKLPLKLLETVWDASAPIRLGSGAFVGDLAQTELERGAGLTDVGRGQQLLEATGQGVVATFGGFAANLLGAPVKSGSTGAGVFKQKPGAARAQLGQQELGHQPLPISAVVANPLVKAIGGQASAMTTGLSEYIRILREANLATFEKFARLPFKDKNFPPMDYLERVHAREATRVKKRVANYVDRKLRPGQSPLSMTEAGEEFSKALDEYDKYALSIVNRGYGRARRISEPIFDDTDLKNTAKTIRRGTPIPQAGGAPVRSRAMNAKLGRVLDMIEKLDLKQPTKESKTDILRAIRQELWELKTPPPGAPMNDEMRNVAGEAGRLYGAVTHTIWDVKNTDPKFVETWRRANKQASKRFTDNESLLFKIGSKSEDPTALAARLSNLNDPATADRWELLVKTLGSGPVDMVQTASEKAKNLPGTKPVMASHAERLNRIRDAVSANLLSDPRSLTQQLNSANPDVLKGVMHQGIRREGIIRSKDLGALRKAGQQFDRLFELDMQNIARTQSNLGVAIGRMVDQEHTATIDYLNDLVNRNGGQGGRFHKMLSAGILGDLLNRSMKDEVEELAELDDRKLARFRNKLKTTGADKLLLPEDARMLESVNLSQRLLRELSDAGTSLQRASAGAQIRSGVARGFATVAENIGVAYAFRQPGFIKAMTGGAKERVPVGEAAQLAGAATATWLSDAEQTGQLLEDTLGFLASLPPIRAGAEFISPAPTP